MELDDTDKYATAALYTLALYSSQIERGVDARGILLSTSPVIWGCPDDVDLDEFLSRPWVHSGKDERFWGWDSVGTEGLCRAVYEQLNIVERSWVGLMKIPDQIGDMASADGVAALMSLVEAYSTMLDPELTFSEGHAVELFAHQKEMAEANESAASCPETEDDGKENKIGDRDGDGLSVIATTAQLPGEEGEGDKWDIAKENSDQNELGEVSESDVARLGGSGGDLEDLGSGSEDSGLSKSDGGQSLEGAVGREENSVVPGVGFTPKLQYSHQAAAKACMALAELLRACLSQGIGGGKEGEGKHGKQLLSNIGYDARSRAALKRVAHWLRIPWPTMVAFEVNLASQLLQLNSEGKLSKSGINITRWLKVGSVAIGGGAAVALTGGLAAPAIAAGLGAAVSMVGGGAAAASAVTGFAASTGGVATITSFFGALGAGSTGSKMLKRTGDVSEFGFWDVSESWEDVESDEGEAPPTKTSFWKFKRSKTPEPQTDKKSSSTFMSYFRRKKPVEQSDQVQGPTDVSVTEQSSTKESPISHEGTQPNTPQNTASNVGSADETSPCSSTKQDTENDSQHNEPQTTPQEEATGVSEPKQEMQERGGSGDEATSPLHDQGSSNNSQNGSERSDPDCSSQDEANQSDAGSVGVSKSGTWWKNWLKTKERRPLLPVCVNPRTVDANLALTICVSGWVKDHEDFMEPWKGFPALGCDRFAMVWETKILKSVGDAMGKLLRSQLATEATKWFIKKYFYTGLLQAVAIPFLVMTLTNITIDNKWAIAMERANKAGILLAQHLIHNLHGHRPVTLIGFSLGARVIFQCLLEMCDAKKTGVVENVILLGSPIDVKPAAWAKARSVVSGRFVNGYSSRDWVLGIVYRAGSGFLQKAGGLSPVEVAGVENVNLSKVIRGHNEYSTKMDEVLKLIDLRQA